MVLPFVDASGPSRSFDRVRSVDRTISAYAHLSSPGTAPTATASRSSASILRPDPTTRRTRDRRPDPRSERRRAGRRRARHDRLALEAARVHLSVVGDLRRDQRRLGLRAAGGRAQEQRQARLVAGDGPGAGRHRRPRCRDPDAPAGLGDLGPRGQLQRPAGRVRDGPPAFPARRAARGGAPDRDRAARPDDRRATRAQVPGRRRTALGAAPLQPDVQDVHGPGRGGRLGRLPATRDRAGLVRQLQERPAVVAQEAAVRDRPDRQVVPQRDQPGQLRLPDARVRADGDAVLRPPGGRGGGPRSSIGCRAGAPGTSATA